MSRFFRIMIVSLGLLLAGCGSDVHPPVAQSSGATSSTSSSPATVPLVDVTSAMVSASSGGSLSTQGGTVVSVGANQLPTDSQATLTQVATPPRQPRSTTALQLTGPAATLEFATARPSGAFQVQLPHSVIDKDSTFGGFFADDIFIPCITTVDPVNNRVTLSVDLKVLKALNVQSAGVKIVLAAGEGVHILPPHVAWGSYNVYYFSNGAFQKIVSLGKPLAALPDLGSKPCVIVHGFGSSIRKGEFDALAASIVKNNLATGIIGFEYDTLDKVSNNGGYLNDATSLFQPVIGTRKWFVVAHSMGGLVSRSFLEQSAHTGIATSGNRLVTLCTPSLGSPVANVLESSLDLFQQFVRYVVLNDIMDFTNANGERCQVPLDSPGIIDLEVGSSFLAALNTNADQNHPEASYFAVGGDALNLEYLVLDLLTGVTTDDGLVTLPSAIDISLCLADAAVLLVNHSSAVTSPLTFAQVQIFLTESINPFCVQKVP